MKTIIVEQYSRNKDKGLLFRMQPVAARWIIFWKYGCAADAVPLLPLSWYSFC